MSETDRRLLAGWAADCAARVLPLYRPTSPGDTRIPEALARVRAYADGRSTTAEEIRLRMVAVQAASGATTPAGAAAARSVAQASGVAHMGAHALGAAAYAVKAARAAAPEGDREEAGRRECRWQRARLPAGIRELVLDDEELRNEICWSVFEC